MQRKTCSFFLFLAALMGLIVNIGCGGVTSASAGGSDNGVPASVSVSPATAALQTGATQQFTATVTGLSSTSVTWSASAGSITASGLYTAPSTAGTYTITATSTADTTKSGSATVTVTTTPPAVSVSISPTSSTIQVGGTQQFTATVTGSSNTSVTWTASGGTVSNVGLYTAPSATGTYTVTATSVADTSKKASATVTVAAAATQLLSVSPSSIDFGSVLVGNSSSQTVTLTNTGTGSVTVTAANFTGGAFSISGGIVSLPVTIAAGASRTATVSFIPSVSGPFSGSISVVSNATNSPATVSLSGAGVAPQQHAVDLSWVGSTSSGVTGYYVYRSTVSGSGYAKINASSAAPTTTYTDSSVQSGLTYYYVVTAVDGSGNESTFSNQAQAVIPTP